MTAYRARTLNASGKRSITFDRNKGYIDMPVTIPCGQCIGCRLEYSRQWAIRCVHEAQMHDENAFVTLTFAPEHLPKDRSIHKEDLQKFMRRLRKIIYPHKVRFFGCGEYGEKRGRPHYHVLIFGYGFPDKKLHGISHGNRLYVSPTLERAWPYGYALIGDVTFQSAAYVARYISKKITGGTLEAQAKRDQEYTIVDEETGECFNISPEFCLMSRRPGIGYAWFLNYKRDTDKDFITINGQRMTLPKYYNEALKKIDEVLQTDDYMRRRGERIKKIKHEDNTLERLETREKVKESQVSRLVRKLER